MTKKRDTQLETGKIPIDTQYDGLKLYKAAIEVAPVAISMSDAKGNHSYHNNSFERSASLIVPYLN